MLDPHVAPFPRYHEQQIGALQSAASTKNERNSARGEKLVQPDFLYAKSAPAAGAWNVYTKTANRITTGFVPPSTRRAIFLQPVFEHGRLYMEKAIRTDIDALLCRYAQTVRRESKMQTELPLRGKTGLPSRTWATPI